MKHLFVPYDLALLAKEKGFNEPCIARYDAEKGEILFITSKITTQMKNYDGDIYAFNRYCAPLYQQLVDWFRAKHLIIITPLLYSRKHAYTSSDPNFIFEFAISDHVNGHSSIAKNKDYYESFNKALIEAFKLI